MPPPPKSYGGPSLPRSLLDQIGGSGATKHSGAYHRNAPRTRKDRRKLERENKRTYKASQPRIQQNKGQQRGFQRGQPSLEDDLEEDDEESTPPRQLGQAKAAKAGAEVQPKSILKKTKAQVAGATRPFKETTEVEVRSPSGRERERLAKDDADIAELEKKLGIRGKQSKKSSNDDGLDDLLGGLEDGSLDSGKRNRGEDREWLERKRRKVDEITSGSEDEDELLESGFNDLEDESAASSLEDLSNDHNADSEFGDGDTASENDSIVEDESEVEGSHQSSGSGDINDDSEDFDTQQVAKQSAKKPARENPYVAPGSNNGPTTAKYIPPSLRGTPTSDVELTIRLRRQTQGLLNRLSEANLMSILREVEGLYQNYPRQYVTETLIDLLLGLISDTATLSDNFLILHAGFVAATYKAIGPDFGAQMVERLVEQLDRCYDRGGRTESDGKEVLNLISLLAQLYNLQVVGSELMFDYIRVFLATLNEVHTELLLRVVRSSGYQLRQDDPSSLKDIVLLLHKTVAEQGEQALSVRTKFMIETINDLKNNKLKTGVAASVMTSEHSSRMRKILGSMNAGTIRASEPLRIGLTDIRNTDKRGKWWLVGASWKGKAEPKDLTDNGQSGADLEDVEAHNRSTDEDDLDDQGQTTDLLTLAKHARMNTSIRRAIFITLMSASDHKDAHVRLLKLNLTRSQELEVPRVLLHCAGAELTYNPYYTVIARKLCGEHKLRMAFQFALWDLFKKMGEKGGDDEGPDLDEEDKEAVGAASMVNYAKLYGALIASGCLDLSVLKNLDLVYLQPKTKAFLEILVITLLLECRKQNPTAKGAKVRDQSSSLPAVFTPVFAIPHLAAGLRYFLRKVVAKTDLAKEGRERRIVKDGCREVVELLAAGAGSLPADV